VGKQQVVFSLMVTVNLDEYINCVNLSYSNLYGIY